MKSNELRNERDLVIRLTRDDESAFCELYSLYKHRLTYFTMKFLKSAQFAEDIYQREVFDLSRNKGLSHKEVAECLNISVSTVQEHLSLALKTVHNYLNKYYGIYTIPILILACLK